MASEEHDAVFDHDLDDDDDDSSQSQDDDDEDLDVIVADDDDDDDLNSVSPSPSSPLTVPIAVPSASIVTVALPNGVNINPPPPMDSTPPDPNPKRQRFETTLVIHQPEEEKKAPQPPGPPPPPPPQQIDESRRLFQRLWTDEDEIELLQGFLDYTTQRGSNHHDTALFYDQIKSKLQLDFNKNQLVEKLRRLKKKYRNVLAKITSGKDFSFKTLHDQATFEISRKIWSSTGKICAEDDEDPNPNPNHHLPHFVEPAAEVKIEDPKSTPRSRKRSRPRSASAVKLEDKRMPNEPPPSIDINNNTNAVHNSSPNVSGLIEETIKSCLSPLLKELLNNAVASAGSSCNGRGIGGLAMNAMPLSFGGGETMVDDKWRKQQILELEVYSKRLELVQDQIKAQLDELRSMSG